MSIKISELTPKGANLQNSDLLEISESTADGYSSKSITGAEIITAAQEGMQPTLVSGTNIKTINGNSLLGSGDLTISGGGGLTIGTTSIASGTIGRILFEGTGNVLQESANLFWDNANGRLGIGTAAPSSFLNVVSSSSTIPSLLISGTNPYSISPVRDYLTINGTGNVGISLVTNTGGFVAQRFYSGTTELGVFYCQESTKDFVFKNSGAGFMDFQTGGNISRLRIFGGGNVAIGTTTDAGYKLDVNGTTRIQSNLVLNGSSIYNNSNLSIFQTSTNRPFSVIASVTKSNGAERILFSLNSNESSNQQAMDFGYIGATALTNRYYYLQSSESGVGYGGGVVLQHNGGWASVGSSSYIASAVFHVASTNRGFLPPRMTNAQMVAIATPASGLMVYDTTNNKMCVYDGTAWQNLY